MGLPEENAADVFQTVFTLLWERLHALRNPQGLAKWLITTTKRECWRVSREQLRELSNDEPEIAAAIAEAQQSDATSQEDLWIDQALIREAMALLDERCRRLLELLYYDEREPAYEEISRRLNMPLGSIGPVRARCLQKMRKLLKAMGLG